MIVHVPVSRTGRTRDWEYFILITRDIVMRFAYSIFLAGFLILGATAQAQDTAPLSPASERYIELLSNGGPASIRNAARSIHRTGESDPRVLDVAAEVLLRDYQTADGSTEIDALAWITNALSNAETDRYQGVLKTVEEGAGHRKLAKYADKHITGKLPAGEPYQPGSVKLDQVAEASASDDAAPAAAARDQGDYHPISVVKVGMSMEEAFALAGPPTATHQHQTGKAWVPFNFKGGDVVRQQALYKGQGRIVLSNTSRYSGSWEVLEVILDEEESGYP